jgi:hypothetical protein
MTIIDRGDVVRDDGKELFELSAETFAPIKTKFEKLLKGCHYVGAIDVSFFVSTQRVYGVPRLMCPHGHFILWGRSPSQMRKLCAAIAAEIEPMLPYAKAAVANRISDGDLLQVIWYANKMPRKQYQLAQREKGLSLKQFKGGINGKNAIRLYDAMDSLALRDVVLAGGDGVVLAQRAFQDMKQMLG